MDEQESKSDLLRQLKIDQQEEVATPLGIKHLVLTAVVVGVLSAGAMWLFMPSAEVRQLEAAEQRQVGPSDTDRSTFTKPQNSSVQTPAEEATSPDGREVLNASGYVTARLLATVSAETMGLITSVEVEEGMYVEAGQVLARLDDSIARSNYNLAIAQMAAQKARLESTRADLNEAERVLARVQALQKSEFSSVAELTRAQSAVDKLRAGMATVEADIDVSRMQVAAQKERLEDHVVRAPFAGVVTVKNAQPGEIVAPSAAGGSFTRTGICTIVDMSSLEIEVDVNEAYIRRVFPGQKVISNLDAYPGWDIPSRVEAIIPTADRSKATVRVRISLDVSDDRILPDMGAKVAFFGEQ